MSLRILTINWHESYIHLLSKTGHTFDVLEKQKAGIFGWIHAIRPVPPNCRLVSEMVARSKLQAGAYDRIIAHSLEDLLFFREWETPIVLVFHTKLTNDIAMTRTPVDRRAYMERVGQLIAETRNLSIVFISESKKRDWGLDGEVLLPGIDGEEYHGAVGDLEKVLRIGNFLKERDVILGYSLQERILRDIPSTILGLNNQTPNATMPRNWDEYRELLRRHRVYLNTTVEPYEDGYNLAMLEAMATGLPVVTTPGEFSPIEDGVNGFVSGEEVELRGRIEMLLRDRSLAASIGRRARQTVLDRFPMQVFVDRWATVLDKRVSPRIETTRTGGRYVQPVNRVPEDQVSSRVEEGPEAVPVRLDEYYTKERHELAVLVPEDAHRILDIGCGGGHLGRVLKEQSDLREVWGIDVHGDACHEARRWLDHVVHGDACHWDPPVEQGYFDLIVLGDILEHLLDPKATLEHYLPWLKPSGTVVLSVPNVRYWGVVEPLVEGYWTYKDEGILDRDHVRFFTWAEIQQLLASCGLECSEVRWNLDTRCPEVQDGKRTELRLGRITIHDLEPDELREFFVFQYLVRGVRTKDRLLAEAERLEASGKSREAFELYADLVARNGGDSKLLWKLTEVGRSPEEKKRASAVLEECLRVHPANTELLIASARLLVEEERVEEAKQRLERVLLFIPDHGEAKTRLEGLARR
jgi:2-polyprenyl-3-methyl-5-hydroxy-6-metoxy-1,4-benzoquinol methylase